MNARLVPLLVLATLVAGCGDDGGGHPGSGGTAVWGRRFGKSTGMDPVALAVDGAGNVVVGGRFFATAEFGGGPVTSPANNWQAFVAKYDRAGALLWMHSLGDIYEERISQAGVDGAGNVYVAGDFRGKLDLGGDPLESEANGSDMFVAKLGPDGSHLWSKRFGVSGYESLATMVVAPSGSVALMGSASDGTDFGTGPMTFLGQEFLAMLDPSGNAVFVESLGSSAEDGTYSYPIALGPAGDGAIAIASSSYSNAGEARLVLTKLGPGGEQVWEKSFDADNSTSVDAIAVGADGGLWLSGMLGAYLDLGGRTVAPGADGYSGTAFVASLKGDGTPRWVQSFSPELVPPDDSGNQRLGVVTPRALAAAQGGVVLTGSVFGRIDFGGGVRQSGSWEPTLEGQVYYGTIDDAFALRLDADGAYMWDASFGNGEAQGEGTAAAVDASGDVLVAGSAAGSMPFAAGEFDATPYYEGFVVKLMR